MRFITVDSNNIVTSIRNGSSIVTGEIESENGELGQIYNGDGTFITPTPTVEQQVYQPTNSEIAQMISDLQADLIIAGVI